MEVIICDQNTATAGFGLSDTSKIIIVGTSGAGKSTLANKISTKLEIKDIELDALFWKTNWQQSSDLEFREKIQSSLANSKGHVIHGNYNKVRDLTWTNCNVIIWLDYSKPLVMFRIIKRTITRIISKKKLWNGNIETIKNSFFAKDSIIQWSWRTYNIRHNQYKTLNCENSFGIKKMIVIKKPKNVRHFLNTI